MNRQDYNYLLAEQTQLRKMLEKIPADDVIDRMSIDARMQGVVRLLSEFTAEQKREPARVKLTFSGQPVVGSYGIFADFGAAAVSKFIDAVSSVAASFSAPLAAMGPIPSRDQNQLLITSTAVGSFGFELEEFQGGQMALIDDRSPLDLALEQTQTLLQGTLGSDDELADSAAGTDPRALGSVRAFLETLAGAEATCAIEFKDKTFRFSDTGQVKRSVERLSKDNLQEEEMLFGGMFQGVLPKRRAFEFLLSERNEVIAGKVGPGVIDANSLNEILQQSVKIKVVVTRVGNGRPRYVLVSSPEMQITDF